MAPFLTSSGECEGTAGHQSTSQQEFNRRWGKNWMKIKSTNTKVKNFRSAKHNGRLALSYFPRLASPPLGDPDEEWPSPVPQPISAHRSRNCENPAFFFFFLPSYFWRGPHMVTLSLCIWFSIKKKGRLLQQSIRNAMDMKKNFWTSGNKKSRRIIIIIIIII